MTLRAALVLALAPVLVPALTAVPAAAQLSTAAASTHPNYQAAYTLAQELRDEKSVLVEAGRAFDADSIALLSQNSALADIERQYPGAIQYMFDAARPDLERYILDSLPELWTAVATLLSAELTGAEIEAMRAYYSSPAGMRFKAATLRNYDVTQEIAPLVEDLDAKVDPAMLRRGIQNAANDTAAELSTEDKAALLRFSRTPAFAKLQSLNPRILQISANWANAPAPEFEARLEEIMTAAMQDFVARKAQ